VTREEAKQLLALGDEAVDAEGLHRAYLRKVKAHKPDVDPEGFARVREAYELLRRPAPRATPGAVVSMGGPRAGTPPLRSSEPDPAGGGAPPADPFGPFRERLRGSEPEGRAAIAREAVAALPRSVEARRVLLALVDPGDAEALAVLSAGAALEPEPFLDELLWRFPDQIPVTFLEQAARDASSFGRMTLVADAQACQARGAESVATVRSSLEPIRQLNPRGLRLVLRPVFSLHAVGLPAAAGEAFAAVTEKTGRDTFDIAHADHLTAILFSVADELGKLGPEMPVRLRQAAGRAAKSGNFDLLPMAGETALSQLTEFEARHWRARLRRNSPTLAKLFRFDRASQQQVRRQRRILAGFAPLALFVVIGLVRMCSEAGFFDGAPSASTAALSRPSVAASSARAFVSSACDAEPESPVCRELPLLAEDLVNNYGPCERLRDKLALVKTSSLAPLSSPLERAVAATASALELRCPP
jgi:hypothetical protein